MKRLTALRIGLGMTIAAGVNVSSVLSEELSEFVEANAIHTLFHEIGHALIDQFQLPVIGQEEDAVDAYATIEVITLYEDDAKSILTDVAANWLYLDAQTDREDLDFYDIHDLDAQRAFRTVCHLYGIDPEQNADAAEWAGLPEDILETCEETGPLALDSWEALLSDIIRDEATAPVEINVTYEYTGLVQVRAALMANGLLDGFAEYARQSFSWPEDLNFTASECGEANAFWDPQTLTVTLCYEILEEWAETETQLEDG